MNGKELKTRVEGAQPSPSPFLTLFFVHFRGEAASSSCLLSSKSQDGERMVARILCGSCDV